MHAPEPGSDKTALAFILNPSASSASQVEQEVDVKWPRPVGSGAVDITSLSPNCKPMSSSSSDVSMDDDDDSLKAFPALAIQGRNILSEESLLEKEVSRLLSLNSHHNGKMRIRKAAICTQPDCPRAAVSRGKCVRHGGGSRCTFPNCTHGARLYNRCFHHGGCKICKVEGCTSKAKRYGYCWSHGGGHICDAPGCSKVAAPGGFCWAHGGGNRCRVEGCNRRSYQKHDYYCKQHSMAAAAAASP